MNNSQQGLLSPEQATKQVQKNIDRRNNQEKRFRFYGRLAVAIALIFLVTLFVTIVSKGAPGFFQYYITLDVELDRERLDPEGDLSNGSLYNGDARGVVRDALFALVKPEGRSGRRAAGKMVSSGSEERIRKFVQKNPELLGTIQSLRFALDDDIDSFLRGFIKRETPEADRRINDRVIGYVDLLNEQGRISYNFSDYLIFGSASRDAEMAGIKGAFIGSIMTLAVCLVLSFPIGVATAVYLEEIAKKNRITEFIEININNLAAVPSVVFGILGLAIFIGIFGMPRSVPLIGGVVLALMTLPTIIISSRAAIRAVPPSVRDAAYGVGASRIQTIFHHVIPLAMPGMLTGTIIGMAQALGETAPLLMIGMVAFIVDVPGSVMDPGTVLPVQIFMWGTLPSACLFKRRALRLLYCWYFW